MLAIRLRPIAAILSLATAVCAHAATPSATYTGGTLSVSIPYQASHSGTGRLVLELLDPEDHILAASTSSVTAVVSVAHTHASAEVGRPHLGASPLSLRL
jgi:hypothetical protein